VLLAFLVGKLLMTLFVILFWVFRKDGFREFLRVRGLYNKFDNLRLQQSDNRLFGVLPNPQILFFLFLHIMVLRTIRRDSQLARLFLWLLHEMSDVCAKCTFH